MKQYLVIVAVTLLVGYLIVVTVFDAVLSTTEAHRHVHANAMDTRPEMCYHYYNDGTDQWKECMGVEYK